VSFLGKRCHFSSIGRFSGAKNASTEKENFAVEARYASGAPFPHPNLCCVLLKLWRIKASAPDLSFLRNVSWAANDNNC